MDGITRTNSAVKKNEADEAVGADQDDAKPDGE